MGVSSTSSAMRMLSPGATLPRAMSVDSSPLSRCVTVARPVNLLSNEPETTASSVDSACERHVADELASQRNRHRAA